jgi:uncharacterized membrane protein YfcA
MNDELLLVLWVLVAAVAFLYSSVGHAGASGYIAVMSLVGLAPEVIRPTALTLNILVATITFIQFYRAGHFSWAVFWPFALLAIPLAFVGGNLNLPAEWFKRIVGCVLLFSAYRFFAKASEDPVVVRCPNNLAISIGGVLGLLAGLTGTGGGIFLTPLLLWKRFARVKEAAAVSALFILCNSVAGLAGNIASSKTLPTIAIPLAVAAVVGGTAGAYLGSNKIPTAGIRRLLAAVLVIAGLKLTMNW